MESKKVRNIKVISQSGRNYKPKARKVYHIDGSKDIAPAARRESMSVFIPDSFMVCSAV